jgi:hypothetical protein
MAAEDSIVAVRYVEVDWAPGYRVGDDGTVWSRRTSSMHGKMSDSWRRLKHKKYPKGYQSINLIAGGVQRHKFVHRLVLESFVGPCPYGMECRHLDGNPSNNSLANLKWDTPANNAADKVAHGTKVQGSKARNSVTNESEVLVIKRLLRVGLKQTVIAYAFGLNVAVINGISSGKRWNHVSIDDESAS